jgi:hypothetical protein
MWPHYINTNFAEVRKRSEMPLQPPSWCLLLLVALSKAGPAFLFKRPPAPSASGASRADLARRGRWRKVGVRRAMAPYCLLARK